ncbi:hypothetical protein CPB83DRAFT_858202, partial [Crepidotus variabilis]
MISRGFEYVGQIRIAFSSLLLAALTIATVVVLSVTSISFFTATLVICSLYI